MSCENPLLIKNPRYKKQSFTEYESYINVFFGGERPPDYFIEVPCGRCRSCERNRMRSYMIRLLYELQLYPNSLFITLTFDDDNLYKFSDNPNKAVRLFLDRVRKHYGRSIRHWIVPELGTLRGRLHYHGILFNCANLSIGYHLPLFWKYGYTYVGYANDRTARYITKYVTKSLSNFDKFLPRIISSKGIGASFLSSENIEYHSTGGVLRPFINYKGFKIPMPRYYYDKLFDSFDKHQLLLERSLNPINEFFCDGRRYTDYFQYVKARSALFNYNLRLGLSFSPSPTKDFFNNLIDKFNVENKNTAWLYQ